MVNFISDKGLSICTILYYRVIYMDFIFELGTTLQEFFLYKVTKTQLVFRMRPIHIDHSIHIE